MEIIFATQNSGKINEVKSILGNGNIKLLSLDEFENVPEVVESGDTFEENAKIKAVVIFNKYKIPVIADDSGIVVEQLNGQPGVYSARYAGEEATDEENNNKLLMELSNYPEPHFAKFVCCAVFYNGNQFFTEFGEIKGRIIKSPRGKNGFGYDPIFVPEGYSNTSAELDSDKKNSISHRAIAFNKLKNIIRRVEINNEE